MVDSEGFRPNVGIVICNQQGQLLWAKRIGQRTWQFPQGGIKHSETLEQALYRELDEEVGLAADDVKILHQTNDWLHYRLPENFIRYHKDPLCIGQKQKWFLLSLESEDSKVELEKSGQPEFDDWRWVSYWYPINQVIEFKRDVYRKALNELVTPLNNYVKQQ
ncbi:MAG: RNA pyrophosphohydrolase [Gammaproteobacteria bacterium]|nr:RNA pyrophosphohydrolase [Gammaproteobacteria bacterium]HJN95713.1 RNA pyrophosphohydrolase [Gammaproteobacteria bacterium]